MPRAELFIVAVERRAVGADHLTIVAHVEEDVGMIEGRTCSDAHELANANADRPMSGGVVEVGRSGIGHGKVLVRSAAN